MSSRKATTLVVALVVGGLMASFLMPIAIDAISGPESVELTQDVDDTDTLQGDLNVTLDSVTEDTDATYTVSNDETSEEVTVDEGANETVTLDGDDVTISLDTAGSDSATSTFEYPTTYGWSSGSTSLWGVLPVIMVLAIFLYFAGMAVRNV